MGNVDFGACHHAVETTWGAFFCRDGSLAERLRRALGGVVVMPDGGRHA